MNGDLNKILYMTDKDKKKLIKETKKLVKKWKETGILNDLMNYPELNEMANYWKVNLNRK